MRSTTKLSQFNGRVDSMLSGILESDLSSADRDHAVREAVQQYNRDAPRDRAVDFAGDGNAYYLLYGKAVDVAESGRDAGIDLTSGGADQKLAVTFTLARTMTIYEFACYLRRTGTSVDGRLTGEIYTDSSGVPGSLIETAEYVEIDDDDEGPPEGRDAKVRFALDEPIILPAGTYHAVLGSSGYTYADGTTEVILGVQQSGSPTNTVSTYNGSAWSAYGTASAGILEVEAATPGWRSLMGRPTQVEYPAADVSANQEPQVLEDDQWDVYHDGDGAWLHFRQHRPSSSETVRLRVRDPYLWTEKADPTVDTPPEHFEAICYLAASKGCMRLAARYGQKHSSTLNADVADRSRQGDFYKSLAKQYRGEYEYLLGMGDETSVKPGMAVVDMDIEPPHGRGFLFHGKETR